MTRVPVGRTLFALLLALRSAQALDLTPVPSFRDLDGLKIPVIEFIDNGTKIQYKPPANWHPSGGGDTLYIYAPGNGESWIKMCVVDKKAAPASANAPVSQNELQALAERCIPKGAKDIAFVRQAGNSFTLEGRASTEFVFTFSFYGKREVASVSLVDRDETKWLAVLVQSNTKDFDSIREQAVSSMFSWRRIK